MRTVIAIIVMVVVLCSCNQNKEGFLRADGQKIVNAQGENVILRGAGLGGWMLQEGYMLQTAGFAGTQYKIKEHIADLIGQEGMEAFYDAWLANYCTKADVDSMAAWGFNSIRLPMHYNLFTLPIEDEPLAGQDTWLERGFKMVDDLLAWCADNQMYLILDLHAAPGGQGKDSNISDYNPEKPSLWESPENQRKTIALWRKLAERYANEPWMGGYDLINEPNWDFEDSGNQNGCNCEKNEPIWALYEQMIKAIREVDKNHIIFLAGNCWGNNYKGLPDFTQWDNNLVISFHKYWNFNNQESIQWVVDMREKYNVPIWLGESGENSNTWFTNAIHLVESNNIGWAWWPYKKIESTTGNVTVSKTEGYQNLLNYWRGFAERPSPELAKKWLMEQVELFKLRHCIINYDVNDAMFRQAQGNKTAIPFQHHNLPGIIFATNYDLGANNFAYFDTDTANYRTSTNRNTRWNRGSRYRNDGVDIYECNDEITNGYHVGSTENGEWLHFTFNINQQNNYPIGLRYATDAKQCQVRLVLNDDATDVFALKGTGGNDQWATFNFGQFDLPKGVNRLKLIIEEGGLNINYIQITH